MYLTDQNGNKVEAEIRCVESRDFTKLKKHPQFKFDWTQYKGMEVYKLCLKGNAEILGLMHVTDFPDPGFDFLMIEQVEIQKQHQGEKNGLNRIGGCLLAYAARLSVEYGHEGFLSLIAKNNKALLFHSKYGFDYLGQIAVMGERMCSPTSNSLKLILRYLD